MNNFSVQVDVLNSADGKTAFSTGVTLMSSSLTKQTESVYIPHSSCEVSLEV